MSKVRRMVLTALREFGGALESGATLQKRFTVRSYALPTQPAEDDGQTVRERDSMSR